MSRKKTEDVVHRIVYTPSETVKTVAEVYYNHGEAQRVSIVGNPDISAIRDTFPEQIVTPTATGAEIRPMGLQDRR
jgi:hypothetical protein